MQQLGLFWLAAQRSLFSIEELPLKDRQGLTSGRKYSLDEVKVTHCSRPKCPAAVQVCLAFLACFGFFQSALNHCGVPFCPRSTTNPSPLLLWRNLASWLTTGAWLCSVGQAGTLHIPTGAAQEKKDEPPWDTICSPQTAFLSQVTNTSFPSPVVMLPLTRIPIPFSAQLLPQLSPALPLQRFHSGHGSESPGILQHLNKSRLTLEWSCILSFPSAQGSRGVWDILNSTAEDSNRDETWAEAPKFQFPWEFVEM